ncbi:MAG: NAD-dependent deacetylase [Sulfuritalea sp.]|nr:NAD-dependent deacetylase [Sulfuritalea sp.]
MSTFFRCAELIDQADGLLITAGAGMGVDSGLPDFRGAEGFWKAYPALAKAGVHFQTIASPEAFRTLPRMAWGFYGHRLNLYRRTLPHDGFRILLELADSMPRGAFVFTSNVDGQFQKAGFRDSEICEAHGSIHHLQCLKGCAGDIWPAPGFDPIVDEEQCLLTSDLPTCPHCGGLARLNILMFGDAGWLEFRERIQNHAFQQWLRRVERPVVIELGAGTSIPTVRMTGQQVGGPLIRINPRESQVPHKTDISLAVGALEGLQGIANTLNRTEGVHERG